MADEFVYLAKPNAGDPTQKSLMDGVIDDLGIIYAAFAGSVAAGGANGSFEIDSDADGKPDAWTWGQLQNGSGTLDNTDTAHGGKSFKFTRSLGAGNGGGTLEGGYFEVSPSRGLTVNFQIKSSVAGMRSKVELRFFTKVAGAPGAFISAAEVYNSITNPTVWTPKTGSATPPATAYYAKVKITGGDTTPDVAGDVWFDEVSVGPTESGAPSTMVVFTANGNWTCTTAGWYRIRAWGAGGGGGGGHASSGGGGGGGGAYGETVLFVLPGVYAVVCPAGGAGGAVNVVGGSPADVSVGSLITVASGAGGTRGEDAGAGGVGGAAPATTFSLGGETGGNAGGAGGEGAIGGRGGSSSTATTAGRTPGGGGKGGAVSNGGAAGGAARVIIEG